MQVFEEGRTKNDFESTLKMGCVPDIAFPTPGRKGVPAHASLGPEVFQRPVICPCHPTMAHRKMYLAEVSWLFFHVRSLQQHTNDFLRTRGSCRKGIFPQRISGVFTKSLGSLGSLEW